MFQGLFVDGFAGGGGASTGIARAIGRDVDIAINHDEMAIAIHKANHPTTEHHCQDIRIVWPTAATRHRPVAGVWFSPDCKEHSKAKGGPVKNRNIRQLPWEIIPWLEETKPLVGFIENVEEMQQWGPLRQRADGGWEIIPELKGREFKRWIAKIRSLGNRVAWRELRACDYGAPTSRKRLYIIIRRDGGRITWPKPTHAPANDNRVLAGKLKPYRTAAECIDWSIPCPSIFDRLRDLKPNTERRIAHGVMRYVVETARPFLVPVTHSGDVRAHDSLEPLRTITTANGGEFAVVDATIAPFVGQHNYDRVGRAADDPLTTITGRGTQQRLTIAAMAPLQNGERRPGEKPREQDIEGPLSTIATGGKHSVVTAHLEKFYGKTRPQDIRQPAPTVMAGGAKHALVSAFLSRFHSSNTNGGRGDARAPLGAVMAGGQHHAVVAAHIEQANTGMVGHDARKPLSTIVGKGSTQRIVQTTMIEADALPPAMMQKAVKVAAFLVKYYGTAMAAPLDEPLDTVTTKDRFAVVTVTIDAVTYVIVDIGMRMLTPRELARAQGFPEDYVLDPVVPQMIRGKIVHKPLTKAAQIRMIGNSVCPDVAAALVAANKPVMPDEWRLAA